MNLTDVLAKKEPLNDELVPYLADFPHFGQMLRHPLVYSVPYCPEMNALLNAQLVFKKARIAKAIADGDFSVVVFMHERPYRMETLANLCGKMEPGPLAKLFLEVWQDSENIWQNRAHINKIVKKAGRLALRSAMSGKDRHALDTLKEPLKIYRGCTEENEDGPSYTLSREKAQWFANRFKKNGKVIEKEVAKKDILFYTNGRGEKEVVLCN